MPTAEDILRHRDNCAECQRLGISCDKAKAIYHEHIKEVDEGIERVKKLRGEGCIICHQQLKFQEELDVGVCAVCVIAVNRRDEAIKWIDEQIDKIDKDERFHYPPSTIETNAPLALIQVDMKSRYATLKQIRKLLEL